MAMQVEQSVQVYLVFDEENGRWIIDPMLVNQQRLDGYDGGAQQVCVGHPDGSECACGPEEGPYAGKVPELPTLDELAGMIRQASESVYPCAYCKRHPLQSEIASGPWNWPGKGMVVNCKTCAGIKKCRHGVEYDETVTPWGCDTCYEEAE